MSSKKNPAIFRNSLEQLTGKAKALEALASGTSVSMADTAKAIEAFANRTTASFTAKAVEAVTNSISAVDMAESAKAIQAFGDRTNGNLAGSAKAIEAFANGTSAVLSSGTESVPSNRRISSRTPDAPPTPDDIAAAAADINAASAEMGQSIKAIEEFLERKNIGVPAWTKVKGWEDRETGAFFKRELGYDRVADSWHIAVRETQGNENWPEGSAVSTWAFNSAPRKSRISAVDKLPDLLRELIKESERIARRIREKTVEVNAFAATLNISTTPKPARK